MRGWLNVRKGSLLILAFLVLGLNIDLHAQQGSEPTAPSQGWLEIWRDTTVSFGTIERDALGSQYYKVVGSGILFSKENATKAYIVTAKHVFVEPAKKWHPKEIQIRFGWQEQESVYAQRGITLKLRDEAGKDLWTALDDESDLAVIASPPPIRPHQPSLGLDVIGGPEKLFEGASIIVLGYPGIVGNEYLVRAISRGGIVAWTNPKSAAASRFLIDANIYPGNSGGPVISAPMTPTRDGGIGAGGPSLLGIVIEAPGQKGDFDLQVPGQRVPLHITQEIPVGGTGVVEPASKVKKLLDAVVNQ